MTEQEEKERQKLAREIDKVYDARDKVPHLSQKWIELQNRMTGMLRIYHDKYSKK